MISATDLDIARRFKEALDSAGTTVHRVVVFGSRARGDSRPDSDLDVLVVLDASTIDRATRRAVWRVADMVEEETGVFIQTTLKTRGAVEGGVEEDSLLMIAVREDGVPI